MQTARRLYVYVLSAISGGALIVGLSMLLTVAFEALGLRIDTPLGGVDTGPEQLTLAAALTTVSLPVWLIHWLAAERSVRPDRPTANAERDSTVRGLYFALALSALLVAAGAALASLLSTALLAIAGADVSYRRPAADLAMLIVAGAAWLYHVVLRSRDWRRGPLQGAAAFLPRTYLYVAAFVGLMLLLLGINGIVEVIGRFALDEPSDLGGDPSAPWWAFSVAMAVSQTLVGGAIWIGHALFADRLRADPGWRGASERPAQLRVAYFVAVIAASLVAVVLYVTEGVRNAVVGALGVSDAGGDELWIGLIVLPILSAVAFGISWWLHQGSLRAEATIFDRAERVDTVDRLILHAGALVGLAFGATGLAWLAGLVIHAGLGGGGALDGVPWQRELAQFLAPAIIGSALWVWNWGALGARYRANPAAEAASTTRRASLLLVLAASVLAGVASLGIVLYRLFGSMFGVAESGGMVDEVSTQLGIVIVAAAVAAYHAIALRRDQALRAAAGSDPDREPPTVTPTPVTLRLLSPEGGNLEATIRALREQLPVGYVLEVVPPVGGG